MIGTHLSRLAEDLIIYGSSEFGFVQFGDAFTTGSSMMPQKRNPDALELARGSAARMLGDLTTLLATLKGLPSELQQGSAGRQARAVRRGRHAAARAAGGRGRARRVRRSSRSGCARRSSSTMMATDLADYLVRKGATFREAHGAVGRLIRQCEAEKAELHTLPLSAFLATHALFAQDVFDALSPHHRWSSARSTAARDRPRFARSSRRRSARWTASSVSYNMLSVVGYLSCPTRTDKYPMTGG